jgi:GNAT superfamily N-acetyltransferase
MESFRTESQLDPTDADVAPIDQRFAHLQPASRRPCRDSPCYARSPEGTLVGGALARWWGTACELQQLWVDKALRRRGIGALLMQRVEATAIERGCRLIYLDTFSFQAPEFYYGLGYEVACRLDGFPDGGSKFILRKALAN